LFYLLVVHQLPVSHSSAVLVCCGIIGSQILSQ
jgi:hypothetical protein